MNLFGLTTLSATTRRRLALAVSLVVVVLLLALMWRFVSVLVPYALSAIIAFLLMPLVNALASRLPGHRSRPRVVRAVTAGLATLLVLLIFAAVIAVALFRLVQGTSALAERLPELIRETQLVLTTIEQTYRERVPANIQAQIDPRLEAASAAIIAAASDAAVQAFGILKSGLSLLVALAGAPIILFYLLYDAPAIGRGIRTLLPRPLQDDICNIAGLAGSTVIAYLRTQLLMALMVGAVIGLVLWAMGVPGAVVLGAAAGMGELVSGCGPDFGFRGGRHRSAGNEPHSSAGGCGGVPGRTVVAKHADNAAHSGPGNRIASFGHYVLPGGLGFGLGILGCIDRRSFRRRCLSSIDLLPRSLEFSKFARPG